MLRTALIEDLNRLGCAADQERHAADPARLRDSLDRLRFIDTTELERYRREGWLAREEADLIERFRNFTATHLSALPGGVDPLEFTRADPGWQLVRERARELLYALDAFIDIGVPGWGHQSRPEGQSEARGDGNPRA
jgi:hypothetical protein